MKRLGRCAGRDSWYADAASVETAWVSAACDRWSYGRIRAPAASSWRLVDGMDRTSMASRSSWTLRHRVVSIWCGGVACLGAATARADGLAVQIFGGPDDSGHNYSWTIENDYAAAIVRVEFPHYLADLFTPPNGWTPTITHPAWEGPAAGTCTAVANDVAHGIKRGGSGVFTMRIGPYSGMSGVRTDLGKVRVTFSDGVAVEIVAKVPVGESLLSRYVTLIGFGLIATMAMLIRSVRARRLRRLTAGRAAPAVSESASA